MIKTCTYLYSSNFTSQVEQARNQSQILIGNRFHLTLHIVSPHICKQWLLTYNFIQIEPVVYTFSNQLAMLIQTESVGFTFKTDNIF